MNARILIFITVIFLLSSTSVDAQCAMCRAVLESDENIQTARGVNNGIMYLMIFPYLLIGAVGYAIYRSRKNAKES